MSAVIGTIRNGQVKFDQASPWPEGSIVEIDLKKDRMGITEEEQGTDPESIARWIEWYRSFEPVNMSKEEEERIEAALRELGEISIATNQDIEKLFP